jgi:hypothetical protein
LQRQIDKRFAADYALLPLASKTLAVPKMIKKIACLLLGFSCCSQPIGAQVANAASANSDRWIVYDRVASDGKPLVVVARIGNASAQTMLRNGLATVVICRADPANVNDQGMPQGTQRLYGIEDKLDEEPTLRAAGVRRIASVTGQGQRRMFFVHRAPSNLAQFLGNTQVQGFRCDVSEVKDRRGLTRLVTATELEIQVNGDQDVIANLQKSGDDGRLARKTDFWFYGQRRPLESLSANLKAHGFSIDRWMSGPTGIVLSRKMPVDLAAFQKLTPIIVDAAGHAGVDYGGWETVVVSHTLTPPAGGQDH